MRRIDEVRQAEDPEALAAELAQEATELLDEGLHATLAEYGRVEPQGSYALHLMVWRDLDLYVVRDDLERGEFFRLGARLRELLSSVKMSYRDELLARTPGLPAGLYWGIYLGDERAGAWKVDVWAVDEATYESARRSLDGLAERLSAENRAAIFRLKSEVWQHPGYRRSFSSLDVYGAVLDEGIRDVDEFWGWLQQRGVAV